ncbi:hypothetical protein [Streptomyces sp. NPDC059761]|uniref:hypothetical protein n=1 Tax=Streptomyces sp. NPDC059761 TaxID=3346937 RepID=UPI00365B22FD
MRAFAAMLDTRDARPQPDWLGQLTNSGLARLAGIATALREAQHAVAQGATTHDAGQARALVINRVATLRDHQGGVCLPCRHG